MPAGLPRRRLLRGSIFSLWSPFSEEFIQALRTIIEYLFQHMFDLHFMDQRAERTKWQQVCDPVDHPGHLFANRLYHMLMIPELVWPDPLLIDKADAFIDMLDLGQPAMCAEQGDPDFVGDHQAVVHCVRQVGENPEFKVRGRQLIKVQRGGEECPDLLRCGMERNLFIDDMHVRQPPCSKRWSGRAISYQVPGSRSRSKPLTTATPEGAATQPVKRSEQAVSTRAFIL